MGNSRYLLDNSILAQCLLKSHQFMVTPVQKYTVPNLVTSKHIPWMEMTNITLVIVYQFLSSTQESHRNYKLEMHPKWLEVIPCSSNLQGNKA